MVTGNSPENVHLELRGTAGRLTAASLAETVVLFDLANVEVAEDRTFTISESNLNLPPGGDVSARCAFAAAAAFDAAGAEEMCRWRCSFPGRCRRVSAGGEERVSGKLSIAGSESARRGGHASSNRSYRSAQRSRNPASIAWTRLSTIRRYVLNRRRW